MSTFNCGDYGEVYANSTADFNIVYNCGVLAGITNQSAFTNISGRTSSSTAGATVNSYGGYMVLLMFLLSLIGAN